MQAPLVVLVSRSTYYPLRWARALRPVLLPFLSKTCAHMVTSIAHTVPSLADLALCVLAAVLFYSLLATSLFGADLQSRAAAANAAAAAAVNASASAVPEYLGMMGESRESNPLGRVHTAILHLLMLLFTADNYPYVLFASYNCDEIACQPYVGAAIYVTFIVFGTIILMSVFVAVVFDVYKRQHGFVILSERVEQQKALLATFALLDTSGGEGPTHDLLSGRCGGCSGYLAARGC